MVAVRASVRALEGYFDATAAVLDGSQTAHDFTAAVYAIFSHSRPPSGSVFNRNASEIAFGWTVPS